jgi:hypothetical protein
MESLALTVNCSTCYHWSRFNDYEGECNNEAAFSYFDITEATYSCECYTNAQLPQTPPPPTNPRETPSD